MTVCFSLIIPRKLEAHTLRLVLAGGNLKQLLQASVFQECGLTIIEVMLKPLLNTKDISIKIKNLN